MSERLVKISAKLYGARDAARRMLGATYLERTKAWGELIDQVARAKGLSRIEAATLLANGAVEEGNNMAVVVILAAAVELIEPSPQVVIRV